MTLWELAAAVDGHNRVHGDGKPRAPSEEEFDALKAAHAEMEEQNRRKQAT